ncbi:hypothetical protein MTR67_013155 [Solanum verrucosum]|uniref:Uncharacterized protein n=1 Tax=Solanum verrucosum TaxID=315347 RepID=A0AAF0QEH3_SOLVR|nr:hypothetical protein MTR67_013155 [Solanum verrucosum]
MCLSNKLHNSDNPQFLDESLYRSIVGGLQYLTFTRPDISFSVNKVCQFMHSPTEKHWAAVKLILRYLKSTSSHGILFSKQNSQQLQGYCDADSGGSIDDRKSTTGFAIFLGPSLVSWCSRKQRSVSRSTTKDEYCSFSASTSELLWICLLLKEIDLSFGSLPSLWCDNLSAISYS